MIMPETQMIVGANPLISEICLLMGAMHKTLSFVHEETPRSCISSLQAVVHSKNREIMNEKAPAHAQRKSLCAWRPIVLAFKDNNNKRRSKPELKHASGVCEGGDCSPHSKALRAVVKLNIQYRISKASFLSFDIPRFLVRYSIFK
jgi:hypothetical protein